MGSVELFFEPNTECNLNITNIELKKDFELSIMGNSNLIHHLICGENLYSLIELQSLYKNKIKGIYIDPPYNTKNTNLVYSDKFDRASWLSFMEIRLNLSKSLLTEDGIIYISVDDTEYAYLKVLCDKIFGEKNYISSIVWQSTAGSNTGDISNVTEYILCYGKSKMSKLQGEPYQRKADMKYKDEYFSNRGYYALDKLDSRRRNTHFSKSLVYSIEAPDGTELWPGGCKDYDDSFNQSYNWLWSKTKVKWGIENGFIEFKQKNNSDKVTWMVYNKRYELVNNKGEQFVRTTPFRNLITSDFATTSLGSSDLKNILGKCDFDYPKPVKLIKKLISLIPGKDILVLDFFAGSGTTGQAVLELNEEDNGSRQFILCTNNENNICTDITYKRLKSLMNKDSLEFKNVQLKGEIVCQID